MDGRVTYQSSQLYEDCVVCQTLCSHVQLQRQVAYTLQYAAVYVAMGHHSTTCGIKHLWAVLEGLPHACRRLTIYETNLPGFVRSVELIGGTPQLPDTAVIFNADPVQTPGAAPVLGGEHAQV